MVSEARNKKIKAVRKQMDFCEQCLKNLRDDFDTDMDEQDKDPWDKWHDMQNHTRHANNVIYIRRQLLKLEKMLKEG